MSRKPKMSDEERKEAKRKQHAEYRRKNPEKLRKRNAEYRRKNPEKLRKRNAEYNRKNPEKIWKRNAEYNRKNAEKLRKRNAEYNRKNAEKLRKQKAEYHRKNAEKIRKQKAEYRLKNAEKLRKQKAEHRKKPEVKIVQSQRVRLKRIVKSTSVSRHEMIGCTPLQLRQHIESQFVKGMTWENQGRWHIDHIMPCSAFDLTNPEQVKVCFNWQNLRPIWAKKNLSKGNKITHPQLNLPIGITQ